MITIVNCDDWEGLYDNGKLVFQGHSISLTSVIRYLTGEAPERYEMYEELSSGVLPDDLSDIEDDLV